jgi:hypothetical protein
VDGRVRAQRALFRRKARVLWALAASTALYALLLHHLPAAAGPLHAGVAPARTAAGVAGIVLGLYACSHPAGNAVDLLFMERGGLRRLTAEWSGVGWLALNGAVFVLGWLAIVLGAIQLASRAT